MHGVAYEGNVPYGVVSRERYGRRAVVELADIPGGYGWVFAKGDHVERRRRRVAERGPEDPRAPAPRSARRTGSTESTLESLRGHRLPLRRPGTRIAAERALLVGDAAGLIDPVSGDGMYECFVSSRLAADAILDLLAGRASTLEPYEAAVDSALAPLHKASWKLKKALDRWPRASWRVARTELLWRSIERPAPGRARPPRRAARARPRAAPRARSSAAPGRPNAHRSERTLSRAGRTAGARHRGSECHKPAPRV